MLIGGLQQSIRLVIETGSIKHLTGDSSINSFGSQIPYKRQKSLTKTYTLQSSQSFSSDRIKRFTIVAVFPFPHSLSLLFSLTHCIGVALAFIRSHYKLHVRYIILFLQFGCMNLLLFSLVLCVPYFHLKVHVFIHISRVRHGGCSLRLVSSLGSGTKLAAIVFPRT